MAPSTSVRVGVRVRPFTDQEINQGGKGAVKVGKQEIRLGERRFTYDNVFDGSRSQEDVYETVSGPLLSSFLDGFNATILAYGQTGSGKTFTMGSEAHDELDISESAGLIPRFMNDIFRTLQEKKHASDVGEAEENNLMEYKLDASFLEVYGEDVHDLLGSQRKSLPLREDSNGGVVCSGLIQTSVEDANKALSVLHEGTHNRTTAATLMNRTSSRSHAVFTVRLQQTFSKDGVITSQFTFVDLAGSERMKKTGAQGERAKEGIQINKGLLALGNVINSLASDEKHHVPYRQSKLTRLLQDALGGNSQTIFLACVSPSDNNASETLSTLHYASRARYIQNAPIQNVDPVAMELHKYRELVNLFQSELIREKFGSKESDTQLLEREDVKEYLNEICSKVGEGIVMSPVVALPKSPVPPTQQLANASSLEVLPPTDTDKSILGNFDVSVLEEVNPDKEMAMLNQLLELQQREHEYGNEQKEEADELKKVEGELAEQEAMLLQLRDSLKIYHDIKAKYEILMGEVGQLENEKAELAEQLSKAYADPSIGCTKEIQNKLGKVEQSLSRAREEIKKHRRKVRDAEQEAVRSRTLEQKIAELKAGRAALMKKQKVAAKRHREYTERRTREISALKRQNGATERKLSKLHSSVASQRRNLDKRQVHISKLTTKLKQTEAHLMNLLAMRPRVSRFKNPRRLTSQVNEDADEGEKMSEEAKSALFMIDTAVAEKVEHAKLQHDYKIRFNEYSQSMRELVTHVKALKEQRRSNDNADSIADVEQEIISLELKTEISGSDLVEMKNRLEAYSPSDHFGPMADFFSKSSVVTLKKLLEQMVSKVVESEVERSLMESATEKKEARTRCLTKEVEELEKHVSSLRETLSQNEKLLAEKSPSTELLQALQVAKDETSKEIVETRNENQNLRARLQETSMKLNSMESALCRSKENLALVEASAKQSKRSTSTLRVLEQIQHIMEELGTPTIERQLIETSITNSLEDTCTRILNEANCRKAKVQLDIVNLGRDLQLMYNSLGNSLPKTLRNDNDSMLDALKVLEEEKDKLLPIYTSAQNRAIKICQVTKRLMKSLDLDLSNISPELKQLVEENRNFDSDSSKSKVLLLSLQDDFLQVCEKQTHKLHLQHSEIVAQCSERRKHCSGLIAKMGISEKEVEYIACRDAELSGFDGWSEDCISKVVCSISSETVKLEMSPSFSKHMSHVAQSLESMASQREIVALALRGKVERAKKILLTTVGSEDEATNAYSDFNQALIQLPQLSKDAVSACVSEISILLPVVESMIQSEVEALTVLWESLGTSSAEKSQFWEQIREIQADRSANDFSHLSVEAEQWLIEIVSNVRKTYSQLDLDIARLEKTHSEVERLQERQQAKKSILSLDSEIRLLNVRVSETRQRHGILTLSRKQTSNSAVDQCPSQDLQSQLAAKLKEMQQYLEEWGLTQSDSGMLSCEVRNLLQQDGRNKFLLPGEAKRDPFVGQNHCLAPITNALSVHKPKSKRKRAVRDTDEVTPVSVKVPRRDQGSVKKRRGAKQDKRMTLPPFGSILESASSMSP